MRILVIEDDKKIANSLKKGLEQEAYSVDVSYDGISGFDLAMVEPYDLLLLDLMLPGMDGLDICKKLREENVQTPIIMLTAKDATLNKIKGLNIGADDYVTKPFSFEELLARIRALLRRPKTVLKTELKCGDLTVNTIDLTVKRAERNIKVSKKEFALLVYLLRNKGKILSKEQIIEHVWDYNADVLPNSVEVYIRYLRNKIDKPFKKSTKLIKTVRGFGYKISEENV